MPGDVVASAYPRFPGQGGRCGILQCNLSFSPFPLDVCSDMSRISSGFFPILIVCAGFLVLVLACGVVWCVPGCHGGFGAWGCSGGRVAFRVPSWCAHLVVGYCFVVVLQWWGQFGVHPRCAARGLGRGGCVIHYLP